MRLSPSDRLGPYTITSSIGRGDMGEVFRARDTRLNRDVAIKVLAELFASDPDRLARFEREAQVLASLNHPNIPHVHASKSRAPRARWSWNWSKGGRSPTSSPRPAATASPPPTRCRSRGRSPRPSTSPTKKGIVHRDLKPANILVTSHGTVKVLDFAF